MSATNTSPIFGNFQRPFPISQEAATRVALKNLVSLLHPPNATLQNLDATKPQGFQAASCGSGQGQPGDDLRGQRLGPHQPTEIQNIAPDTGSDCDNGNASTLKGVAWPAPEETTLAYHDSSQGREMVAALRMRFDAPTSATAGSESPKPLESPIPRWPGTGKDKSGFFETVEVKTELSEVPLEALQYTERLQNTQSVALVTSHQVVESAIEGLSGSDADASLPTNADGEPDMNDEALERLVAESGLHMDELLSGVMEPEAFTTSESSQPSVAQRVHGDIGDLVGHGSEESMSLDQINALLGYLTENMDLGEPVNTSSPHSTNLVSHDQVADPTQDTIAAPTNNWRNRQYPSTPSANTISRGTKRCSPDDSSSLPKRICKPPQSPIALTQLQAILQSSDHSQPISRHHVSSSYASSFGNSENMNKRLMKPPPYRPASKSPSIGITTGPGSAATIHAKSNEHEKKVKSMGFPPLMAGMKPK
ncbi:unnamed protein product [Tuber melanosporum]|uniref:(Perigord truffle) hypothetical protein n=1 Tax=Tuber melanosporum (strain Mel28) TaxID=656061 RepID=D5G4G9_TUBMM|nr:uncharacterized protein GSTUM_00004102001 [Tuber melanosporum]CAZ79412.1 unnamed protein product [Tuber melanosporum]